MLKYNYPETDQHKQSHAVFRASIIDIDLPRLGKHPEEMVPQIKDHLQDFLFNHVMVEDQALGRYLVSSMKE